MWIASKPLDERALHTDIAILVDDLVKKTEKKAFHMVRESTEALDEDALREREETEAQEAEMAAMIK